MRVGYPMQTGLTEIDENGNYSGYTYEYLQEMAQYNGWNFEFVTVEGTLMNNLQNCWICLEKARLTSWVELYIATSLRRCDYPGYSYGTAYSTI